MGVLLDHDGIVAMMLMEIDSNMNENSSLFVW